MSNINGELSVKARLSELAVSQVSDVMNRFGVLDSGIKPIWHGCRFVGRAVTVLTTAGDNKVIHEAIPMLQEGDVLVVNGQGYTNRALVGELMAERAQRRGCVAYVIDGAVRDVDEIERLGFPVYARSITPAGPHRNGPGKIGVPTAIGGIVVSPGDWIVGDSDGVVVIPINEVQEILSKAEGKRDHESQQQRDIRAGLVDV